MPFEAIELELAEGSPLVLYTDGLIEDRHRDIDSGLEQLRDVLPGRVAQWDLPCDPATRRPSPASAPRHRWGTRYTPNAKIIWTEQPLPRAS